MKDKSGMTMKEAQALLGSSKGELKTLVARGAIRRVCQPSGHGHRRLLRADVEWLARDGPSFRFFADEFPSANYLDDLVEERGF